MDSYKSETRASTIRDLIERVKKQNYKEYLLSIRLEKIRMLTDTHINFEFPVTALIGPNGSGKTTVLNSAICAYQSDLTELMLAFFPITKIADNNFSDWKLEFDIVDKNISSKGLVKVCTFCAGKHWKPDVSIPRVVKHLGISRTVPLGEKQKSWTRKGVGRGQFGFLDIDKMDDVDRLKTEVEKILGKTLYDFEIHSGTLPHKNLRQEFGRKGSFFIASDGKSKFSEFNFGSGEASVIRMVAETESSPDYSLILIEELENGLHQLAVIRMVEYLIDVAKRKSLQIVFTTHSEHAIAPLPAEAIWACVNGKLQQGKLSVEVIRAISGRIDRKLAIFVEDEFSKSWIESILREKLSERIEEIGVYDVGGDDKAVKVHLGHISNPSIQFHSLCIVDGDSHKKNDSQNKVFRLPGDVPEVTVFNSVIKNLDKNITSLTIACQRSLDKQSQVAKSIQSVSLTNRDHHLLFSQVGQLNGFVPEEIIRGAFLSIWIQENPDETERIAECIRVSLELPPKISKDSDK